MPADAYFITFCTYGTHLPGDDRGSNTKTGGYRPPNAPLRAHCERLLKSAPVSLCEVMRPIVLRAIVGVAEYRRWRLIAAHVRTEHVHCVVSGDAAPERMMGDFKAYATRALREAGFGPRAKVWAHHGSTRWLWGEDQITAASRYVYDAQGEPMSRHP